MLYLIYTLTRFVVDRDKPSLKFEIWTLIYGLGTSFMDSGLPTGALTKTQILKDFL